MITRVTKNSLPSIVFFLAYLVIGLSIVKDYGISTDEWNNRLNGAVSFKYVYDILTGGKSAADPLLSVLPSLHNYVDKDYGVIFDLPLFFIEWKFRLTGTPGSVYLRHTFIFLLFFTASIFFYRLVYKRFNNHLLAFIAVLMMVIAPRIFAHSFFNIKDQAFLSVFIIGIYFMDRWLKQPSFKNSLWLGLIMAVAINVRILGILLPMMLTAWVLIDGLDKRFSHDFSKKYLKQFLLCGTVCILVVVGTWPYLWNDVATNFFLAFKHMARFRWVGNVDYFGETIKATELPWHYIPVYIMITTPVVYSVLFFTGCCFLFKCLFKKKLISYLLTNRTDYLMLGLIIVPIAIVILLKSVMYGDWRHMYFTYASFVYIAVLGLHQLIKLFRQRFANKGLMYGRLLYLVVGVQFISTIVWMMVNHPYQHLYYSFLSPKYSFTKFNGDYWYLTSRKAFEYVASKNEPGILLTNRADNLFQCYQFLPDKRSADKLQLISNKATESFDDNFLDSIVATRKPVYFLGEGDLAFTHLKKHKLKEVYSVVVEGNKHSSVYRLQNNEVYAR